MTYPNTNVYAKPAPRSKTGRALLACGLWLRVGYFGASATIVGLIQLFGGETTPLSPLALTLGGAVLAVVGWRRAYSAVERMAEPRGVNADESAVRSAASGGPATGHPARTPAAA